ncbi:class I SAM-dependent methyltransferase [bacterium]|nr:class I SAM-dependent methyltransferase [bacterium]
MCNEIGKNSSLKKCLICGGSQFEYILSSKDKYNEIKKKYNVLSCLECGYSFTYLPSDVNPSFFYPDNYRQFKKGLSDIQKWIYFLYYDLFFPVGLFSGGREILDIGSGNGLFSSFLKSKSFKVICVEKNERLSEFSKKTFCLNVLNCELIDAGFPENYFDVVISRHSMEHIDDIPETLKEIKRVLKKDGRFFLELPNIDSLEFKIFGSNFYHLDLPRHINHFSLVTIKKLLTKYNFKLKYSGFDNFMPHSFSMSFIYHIEDLIRKSLPCIIRRIIVLMIYPLSFFLGLIASYKGQGSIIRILAVLKG